MASVGVSSKQQAQKFYDALRNILTACKKR